MLSACSSVLPPTQAMSDARQAIQAARDIKAHVYLPANIACAERRLHQAEKELSAGPHAYHYAHFNAEVAKEEAVYAHQLTQTLLSAESGLQQVKAQGFEWLYTEVLLKEAKALALHGDLQKASALAASALEQVEQALAQAEAALHVEPVNRKIQP
ncbi:Uncharacterised protein [Candidatus Venteria ishoeyi]|uniref:DUF4398 domain-containing protein n=2 Tax=Candidatus Venteria ishoeyi TaxID=1899563 RepID=A0A1H6F4B1_9GAMM|nr:Uncharacterised protein [Candidatus Venteria ishoeyi]